MNHLQAKTLVEKALPDVHPLVRLLVRLIGALESGYGSGWGPAQSRGSNNWGAIIAGRGWTGETFEHPDSKWDDKLQKQVTYIERFRKYPTPEDGIRDLYKLLTGPTHGRAAELAQQGRFDEVSTAMRDSSYYLGFGPRDQAIATHRKRLLTLLAEIVAQTGEVVPKAQPAGPAPSSVLWRLASPLPPISEGETGSSVELAQVLLGVKVDGLFGPVTARACQSRIGKPHVETAADWIRLAKARW